MEKKFIATGKDFDSAVQAALKELGLEIEQVSVQLLERAKNGVFGFGARPCKVEVTYEMPDSAPTTALSAASRLLTHRFQGFAHMEEALLLMKDKPRDLIKPVVIL